MDNPISSAVSRLEKETSFIDDGFRSTTTVVSLDSVKRELEAAQKYVDNLEEKIGRYHRLLYNTQTTSRQ